jgi:hypothetical protein
MSHLAITALFLIFYMETAITAVLFTSQTWKEVCYGQGSYGSTRYP